MTSYNGTWFTHRPQTDISTGTRSLSAVALSIVLLSSTGYATALPPILNGTQIAHVIGTISSPSHRVVQADSMSAMLTDIRSNFQLSTTELAQVLGVSRPTLYAWSSEKATPRANHVRKVQTLRAASISWRLVVGDRTNSVAQRYNDKQALLEVLTPAEIDDETLSRALTALASVRHDIPRAESLADRLRKLGFAEQTPEQQSRSLENQGW